MSDDNSTADTLKTLAILGVIFAIPIAAPTLFYWGGLILWSFVYISLFFKSFAYDTAKDLPVYCGPTFFFILIWLTITGWALGHVRSPLAGKAMLIFWGGLFMFPTYVTSLGMAVPVDWDTYKLQNYIQVSCERVYKKEYTDTSNSFHEVCYYIPQQGHRLPVFYEDITSHSIEKTIPYKEKN